MGMPSARRGYGELECFQRAMRDVWQRLDDAEAEMALAQEALDKLDAQIVNAGLENEMLKYSLELNSA